MELIYTDENFTDIGVLKEAVSDFAFGKDENDFEITTTKKSAKLIMGGFVYYEDTEYGGIIDSVKASNNSDEIKYDGRTWHGILNSFVMNFDSQYMNYNGEQYSVVEGVRAVDLVSEIINHTGLPIDVIDTYDGTLTPVTVDARQNVYDFLISILKPNKMKLYFRYSKGLKLYVGGAMNYDDEHNFDSKQITITATDNRKFTNHFLLHYKNDETSIHKYLDLYTDADGNLQPYTLVDNPLRDEDYITDDRNKVLSGKDEVVSMIEESSSKENYRLENAEPSQLNWKQDYRNYYEYVLKDNSYTEYEFKQLKSKTGYIEIENEPTYWRTGQWTDYYKKTGDDSYTQLSAEDLATVGEKVTALYRNSTPSFTEDVMYMSDTDWKANYSNYFTRLWDGNKWVYSAVQGVPDYRYNKLGSQPSDDLWNDKSRYYVYDAITYYEVDFYRRIMGKYQYYDTKSFTNFNANSVTVGVSKTMDSGEIRVSNYPILSLISNLGQVKDINDGALRMKMTRKDTVASFETIEEFCKRRGRASSSFRFSETNVYEKVEVGQKAPDWEEPNDSHSDPKGYFMVVGSADSYPNFAIIQRDYGVYGTYTIIPSYVKNTYYLKVQDHFASMIEKAKGQLDDELNKLKSATGNLNIETYDFDVGDLLGGINPLTSEPFKSVVTKKIAKIDSFKSEVSYEIG